MSVVARSARSGRADVAAVAGAGVRSASGFVLDVVVDVVDVVLLVAEISAVFAELERRPLVLENLVAVVVFVDEVVAFVGFVAELVVRVGVDDRSVVGLCADCRRSVAAGFGIEAVGFVEFDRPDRFVADGPFVAIETELVGRFVVGAVVAEIVVDLIELGVDDLIAETEPVAEIAVLGPESAEIEYEVAGRFAKAALAASERGRCSPA